MSLVIKTQSPVYGGYVIARDKGIIFIRGALPEEVIEISIREKKGIILLVQLQISVSLHLIE